LRVASINALQGFNDWTMERGREARALIAYAAALAAPGIVLCPVVDMHHGWSEAEQEARLCEALHRLRPILVDGGRTFRLCYDTFRHYRSRDSGYFPAQVGLMHVSGVTETTLARDELKELHRGYVTADDLAGNIGQVSR
jgi:2-keto-myo-inositol isomerase